MAVRSEVRGRVAVVRIERPEKRNAIDAATTVALSAALDAAQDDPAVRAVVLTGTDAVFSAGTDIDVGPGEPTERGGPYGVIRRAAVKPLVAAVEGLVLGGGFEIALACHLVVASRTASFGLPEVQRGLVANSGALLRAARCLPRNVAHELLLTGARLSAERAHEVGFVNRLAEPGRAVEVAVALAETVVHGSPTSVRATLVALQEQDAAAEEAGWAATARAEEAVRSGPDLHEGLSAFAEKRAPRWTEG